MGARVRNRYRALRAVRPPRAAAGKGPGRFGNERRSRSCGGVTRGNRRFHRAAKQVRSSTAGAIEVESRPAQGFLLETPRLSQEKVELLQLTVLAEDVSQIKGGQQVCANQLLLARPAAGGEHWPAPGDQRLERRVLARHLAKG